MMSLGIEVRGPPFVASLVSLDAPRRMGRMIRAGANPDLHVGDLPLGQRTAHVLVQSLQQLVELYGFVHLGTGIDLCGCLEFLEPPLNLLPFIVVDDQGHLGGSIQQTINQDFCTAYCALCPRERILDACYYFLERKFLWITF